MESTLSNTNHIDSNDLCELLPWYVNGTLTETERQKLEQHLQRCKACEQELPILGGLRRSMQDEPVTVLMPPPDTQGFLATLGEDERRGAVTRTTWLAAALAATILVATFIFYWAQSPNPSSPQPVQFETVFKDDAVIAQVQGRTYDYVLLVALDENLDASQRQSILSGLDPLSVSGPDSLGQYRVVKRLPAHSMAALDDYRQSLESELGISKVSVVALELPVE